MNTCLVTGCAGFIGSHLSETLLRKGDKVIGIDGFIDNYSGAVKKNNLKNIIRNHNFSFIKGNLLTLDIKKSLKGVDYIFHQAALPGVRQSWGELFKKYTDNNIMVTQRLLEAVKGSKIKKFIYASSSSIYGDSEYYPTDENTIPRPFSPYGVTKLAAEHLCNLYCKNYQIPTISLRYFTVYGPRQRPDMAFHKFIKSTVLGEKIEIYGDGEQTRDFTYISDVINANILAMNSNISGEIFNIGGGTRISIKKILKIISTLTGKKIDIIYKEAKKGDVKNTSANIKKAKKMLGYQPEFCLENGLNNEIRWLKDMLKNE